MGNLSTEAKPFGVCAIAVVIVLAIISGMKTSVSNDGTNTTAYTCLALNRSGCDAVYNDTTSLASAAGSFATWGTIIVLLMVGAYLLHKMGGFGGKK